MSTFDVAALARAARAAQPAIAALHADRRAALIVAMAVQLRAAQPAILAANAGDVARAGAAGLSNAMIDRLRLDAARIEDIALALEAIAGGLTVREAEETARRTSSRSRPPALDADSAELENRIRETLRTKVELHRGRRGGRLVIHFFSEEELEGIYHAIVGE